MNILKGRLNKKQISKFLGVEPWKVDESLANLSGMGYLDYRKIKGGKYQFILYPEKINEIQLTK